MKKQLYKIQNNSIQNKCQRQKDRISQKRMDQDSYQKSSNKDKILKSAARVKDGCH